MDLPVQDIPYVLRKAVVKEELKRPRTYIDSKRGYFIWKRIFDITISLLVIACILSWLLPLMALLIRMDSRGPVFFRQKRTGKGGRAFTCYKLRTMHLNGEADLTPALEHDHRITRIGRLLRKHNLDELPQFFNVLAGSMSMVGPRPHMIADCNRFSVVVPGYKMRNLVRPGITGLAQVKGFRGPAMDARTISSRYGWDFFYVRNGSFFLDMRIIRQTFGLLLTGI